MKRRTNSAAETQAVASEFAEQLRRGDIVALFGELGSGKTQFIKGMCVFFGVREHIASPTFILLNRYLGRDERGKELLLFHFDLYRIKSLSEVFDLGYEEFFAQDGICMIEWAEQLKGLLPSRRFDIRISFGNEENQRIIEINELEGNAHSTRRTVDSYQ